MFALEICYGSLSKQKNYETLGTKDTSIESLSKIVAILLHPESEEIAPWGSSLQVSNLLKN